MIHTYEKFCIPDRNKDNDFFAEVNWNPKDEKTNGCKFIKFTFPDGRQAVVDKKHLMQFLFAVGDPQEQTKMIPIKTQAVHWQESVYDIQASKDIKKGENITVRLKVSVPCTIAKEIMGTEAWRKDVQKAKLKGNA